MATYRERYHRLLEQGVPFFPDAAWKDVVVMIAVVAAIIVLAITIGAKSLGKLADPTNVQAYPRPD